MQTAAASNWHKSGKHF